VFTARYGLMPYIKQITFRLLKVKSRRSSEMHAGWGSENLKKRDYLQDLRGRIILKCIPDIAIYLARDKKDGLP
jgi:hypothetical protein